MLALNEALAGYGARRIALVTPYLDEIQERIVDNYRSLGLACIAERHLRDPGNFSFALVPEDAIAAMIREGAKAQPQAIATVYTNLRAAPLAPALEPSLGVPILHRSRRGLQVAPPGRRRSVAGPGLGAPVSGLAR